MTYDHLFYYSKTFGGYSFTSQQVKGQLAVLYLSWSHRTVWTTSFGLIVFFFIWLRWLFCILMSYFCYPLVLLLPSRTVSLCLVPFNSRAPWVLHCQRCLLLLSQVKTFWNRFCMSVSLWKRRQWPTTTHQVHEGRRALFLSNYCVFDGDLHFRVTGQWLILLLHLQSADWFGVRRRKLGHEHCMMAGLVIRSPVTGVAQFWCSAYLFCRKETLQKWAHGDWGGRKTHFCFHRRGQRGGIETAKASCFRAVLPSTWQANFYAADCGATSLLTNMLMSPVMLIVLNENAATPSLSVVRFRSRRDDHLSPSNR